ncbi:single-stranded DNA-binding protein 4 isoform X2 [Cavia porcellus]|uniref:single-stranded DNA-binding protein 4 isoform X2 n=1 Tax=Cavia porcellus TaxID=10141 RepID=UPI000350EE5D|nr:single-stranded DNA-binding protein 4 isoform X1 [Cavia porcellus]
MELSPWLGMSWRDRPRAGAELRLALYVYEYLLHVGAQKSAQTFLSEIRWEKNITLGEPPGFLHSWWCVFWDLYCAAPDRREACEHTGEAKAFQDHSAAATPSPVMGTMTPGDAMAAGPMAPGFFQPFMSPRFPGGPRPTLRMPTQPPVGLPGSQPLLPGTMDPSARMQGHSSMSGPMQRVPPPRGMAAVGPQGYGGGLRPPPNTLAGPGLTTMNMAPGVRGPWASPSGNSIPYSSSSPVSYTGPPGGGGPPGTPIMPSPGDSTTSSEGMFTLMNPLGPSTGRANFPLGPGAEGPMATVSTMEPHPVNGSLGSGDMDGLPKSSPGTVAGLSTAPGTPRDDGEMAAAGTFLHPFPGESYSPGMTMSV